MKIVESTAPMLPLDRPRYLMGVGRPEDILAAIARGIDMFDCVMPTRNGRHGVAFTRHGPIALKNARHAEDPRPLEEASGWAPLGGEFNPFYQEDMSNTRTRNGFGLGLFVGARLCEAAQGSLSVKVIDGRTVAEARFRSR